MATSTAPGDYPTGMNVYDVLYHSGMILYETGMKIYPFGMQNLHWY